MSSSSKYFPLIFLAAVLLTTTIVSADHRKHHPAGRLLPQDDVDSLKPIPEHKPHTRHDEAPHDHHLGHVLLGEEEDGHKPFPEHKPPKLEEEPRKGKGEKLPSEEDEDKLPKGKEGKPPHDQQYPGHVNVEEVEDAYISSRKAALPKPWAP